MELLSDGGAAEGGTIAEDDNKDEDIILDESDEECFMIDTPLQCDKCWYHFAESDKLLTLHKVAEHITEPYLCLWTPCRKGLDPLVSPLRLAPISPSCSTSPSRTSSSLVCSSSLLGTSSTSSTHISSLPATKPSS